MNYTKQKLIVLSILIFGVLVWSLLTMINSFDTNQTWRIILSTIGFLGFFILTFFFVKSMINKFKIENTPKK